MVNVLLDGWYLDSRRLTVSISIKKFLPDYSWELGEASGRYEVEEIVDDDLPLSPSIGRTQRRFLVKRKAIKYRHGSRYLICHAEVCYMIIYGRRSERIG